MMKYASIHSLDKVFQLLKQQKASCHDGLDVYVNMHLTVSMCVQLPKATTNSCLSHRTAHM